MITAEEARKIFANSEIALKKELEIIDEKIRSQCAQGERYLQHDLPNSEMIPVLIKQLNHEYGFITTQLHSKGIKITW